MLVGCKKSGSVKPSWTTGVDVYMVGSDKSSMDSGRACYWKNGVETKLGGQGYGIGIAVSGTDVVVGGNLFKIVANRLAQVAVYWKNGVEYDLTDSGYAWAYGPALAGGDV